MGNAAGDTARYTPLDDPVTPTPPPTAPPPAAPSLIEQLFPERYAAGGSHREQAREVPRIPAQPVTPPGPSRAGEQQPLSKVEQLRRTIEAQPPVTSVVVLRGAADTLAEEDFRRVIPQGKHLEGWTLEQGDILRVIPGRRMDTLEPTGYYFLIFSSPLSAFMYKGHVQRIHRVVAANAPTSLLSPIAPPPGFLVDGLDAHEAISAFTLLPPDQRLDLRKLRPPLAPAVQSLIEHGGYAPLVKREDRMPYEARLTLEGPQFQLPAIRHILRTSGRDRGFPWSGTEDELPKLSQWEPVPDEDMISPSDTKDSAMRWAERTESGELRSSEKFASSRDSPEHRPDDDPELKRRTPHPVYIAGFSTQRALQSFIHFWHGRAMTWDGAGKAGGDEEGDFPPVAHVQALW